MHECDRQQMDRQTDGHRATAKTALMHSVAWVIKSRLETFWYQLTQIHLENGRLNGERIYTITVLLVINIHCDT